MVTPERLLKKVQALMQWDRERALLWLMTPNPYLGYLSPFYLVKRGLGHKVEAFIDGRIMEELDTLMARVSEKEGK